MERFYLLIWWGSAVLGALLGTTVLTLLVCRLTMGRFRPLRLLPLLLGKLTRRRFQPLRLLPLGFLLIPLAGGVYGWKQGGFLWQLEVALWAMIGGAIFLGWLFGRALCGGKERKP